MAPSNLIDLTICIINWNSGNFARSLINSIKTTIHTKNYEILVVDNASSESDLDQIISQYPNEKYIKNSTNAGYAKAINQACKISNGNFILILNPDVLLKPETIHSLINFLESNPEIGAVGGNCLLENGMPGPSYGFFPTPILFFLEAVFGVLASPILKAFPLSASLPLAGKPKKVDYIIGACLLFRRETYTLIGEFDQRFFAYFEETDWCLRLKRSGLKCYALPTAHLIHYGGKSFNQVPDAQLQCYYDSLYKFMKKYHGNFWSKLVRWSILTASRRRVLQGKIRNSFFASREKTSKELLAEQTIRIHTQINE